MTRVLGYIYGVGFVLWLLFWVFLLSHGVPLAETLQVLPFLLMSLGLPVFILVCANRIEEGSEGWPGAALAFWIGTTLLLAAWAGPVMSLVRGFTRWIGPTLFLGEAARLPVLSVVLIVDVPLRIVGIVAAVRAIRACRALRLAGRA